MERNDLGYEFVVYCCDCKKRGDPERCPMCFEIYYTDHKTGEDKPYIIDRSSANGYCNVGEYW